MSKTVELNEEEGRFIDSDGFHYVCVEKLGETNQLLLTQFSFGSALDQNGAEWFHEDEVDDIRSDVMFECRREWEAEVEGYERELRTLRDVVLDVPELRSAIANLDFLDRARVETALGLRP